MDKRTQPRVDAEKNVRLTILNGEPAVLPAMVANISEGGMRLLSGRAVEAGTPVGVEWDIPSGPRKRRARSRFPRKKSAAGRNRGRISAAPAARRPL